MWKKKDGKIHYGVLLGQRDEPLFKVSKNFGESINGAARPTKNKAEPVCTTIVLNFVALI